MTQIISQNSFVGNAVKVKQWTIKRTMLRGNPNHQYIRYSQAPGYQSDMGSSRPSSNLHMLQWDAMGVFKYKKTFQPQECMIGEVNSSMTGSCQSIYDKRVKQSAVFG